MIDYTQPDTDNIPTVGDIEKPLSPKNLTSQQQPKKQPPPSVLRHLIMNEHRNRVSALETPSESRARHALTALSSPTHNPRKLGLAIEAKHIDPKRLLHQELPLSSGFTRDQHLLAKARQTARHAA